MSSGGGFSGGGGGYSGGFGPPMGGFGGGFGPPMGGFGQQFGGFQPPQYGGGFGQPFGGGFQQPQYGGGFGFQQPQFGGFQNQGPGNAYARQNPYQPPPGMEVNPNYQPSNRLSQDVRPSDMQFRPIQARTGTDQPPPGFELNPEYRELPPGTIRSFGPDSIRYRPIQGSASPEPAPSPYGSTEPYKAISDSPLNLQLQDLMRRLSETPPSAFGFAERLGGSPQGAQPFVPDERQLGPAIQPNPGFRGNFSGFGDTMRDQGVGFGNPYGGFGAPYGGSPYMGMLGGLGGFFGGNGFQGMNQQARAQMDLMDSRRSGFDRIGTFVPQQNQADQQAKLLAAQQGQQPSVETDAEFNQRVAQKESEYYADLERTFGKERADQIRKNHPVNFSAGSTRGATGNMGSFDYRSYIG